MSSPAAVTTPAFDPAAIRLDFPILQQQVNGQPLVYLDNAATTQKPEAVIEAISHYYRHDNANVHRGAHTLSDRATVAFENARTTVARFINSPAPSQVIWVRGATEAINLVANSWGRGNLRAGDRILVSYLEHHSNIVPWQLIAAATEARQHAGASGSLLSALSHEIRTPLGSILGLSRIGEQESTGRSIQALFQRIEKSGKYLLEVVDKILDYSALKADRLVLEHTVVRTADLIDRSMDLVAERAQAKRLALLVDESPGLPEMFIGDGLRITQVMVNLLGNAIKFTDRGHVLLRVRATREMLRIEVEDTGIGIDAQHLERLFQPFVQADASTARRYGGSGLGLAISRDLATAMNGRLSVDSTAGQGSRFSFTLPLRQPRWPDSPGMMPATVIRLAGLPEPQSRHLSAQLSDRGCAVECVPVEDAYLLPLPTCVVVPRRSVLTHPQPSGLKLRTLWTLEHGELPPEPEQGAQPGRRRP